MTSPRVPAAAPAASYLEELPVWARYAGSAAAGEIQLLAPDRDGTRDSAGVVYSDPYIRVVRDAVLFPSGARGTYLRIFANPPADGPSGAVVLPLLDGRVWLRKMFRHATRAWEYEAPRGSRRPEDPSIAATASRELREELGSQRAELVELGIVYADTGLLASSNAVFLAHVADAPFSPEPDAQEALGDLVSFSRDQLLEAVAGGVLRDGLTLSAVSLALARGLL